MSLNQPDRYGYQSPKIGFSAVSVDLMRAKWETYSAWPRRRGQRARRRLGDL